MTIYDNLWCSPPYAWTTTARGWGEGLRESVSRTILYYYTTLHYTTLYYTTIRLHCAWKTTTVSDPMEAATCETVSARTSCVGGRLVYEVIKNGGLISVGRTKHGGDRRVIE